MTATLSHLVVPQTDESQSLAPQQEIALDLAFNAGIRWRELRGACTSRLMDYVGGSHGLHMCVMQWAREFERHWHSLPESEQQDYPAELDLFLTTALETLITAADSEFVQLALIAVR